VQVKRRLKRVTWFGYADDGIGGFVPMHTLTGQQNGGADVADVWRRVEQRLDFHVSQIVVIGGCNSHICPLLANISP